jgi:hypothetical protein
MEKIKIILVFLSLFFLAACTSVQDIIVLPDNSVYIPEGYSLVAVSEYGAYNSSGTLYVQDDITHVYYECVEGKIGDKIPIPEGYSLVAVSEYGKYTSKITMYCVENQTGKHVICPDV